MNSVSRCFQYRAKIAYKAGAPRQWSWNVHTTAGVDQLRLTENEKPVCEKPCLTITV